MENPPPPMATIWRVDARGPSLAVFTIISSH
jgi:hypothetical protein